MPTLNSSTTRELNNLIEFRQMVYDHILEGAKDAQFELMDALLLSDQPRCFGEVSLSPTFRRLVQCLWRDCRGEPRSAADGPLLFKASAAAGGAGVPLGYDGVAASECLDLEWLGLRAQPDQSLETSFDCARTPLFVVDVDPHGQSWSPSLFSQRLKPEQKAIEVGASQVKQLCLARPDPTQQGLDVVVTDGHYGNHHFFQRVQGLACAILSRLRCDRVLYLAPGPYRGWGRPVVHGARFAFKAPETWPEPVEQVEFNHERWDQVRLRRWSTLHAKQDAETSFEVILAEVHLERPKPPDPLWLGYLPGHHDYPLQQVWSWFDFRWPIELSIRFRKQYLAWTLPYFQTSEACDRWTHLVEMAYWQIFLARHLGSDQPLPWQKVQARLTPGRVLRSIGAIFSQIGTPAQPPKTRGKSPGWPKGRIRQRPERYKPTKRTKKKVNTA